MADHLGTHAVAFGRVISISNQHISSSHMCCVFVWTNAQDKGSERHLIQICIVSNDFMVSLLNGLQMCNNSICQSAFKLAPSHIFDLLSNDILQHCTQPLYATTYGNAGQQSQLQACLKPTWSKLQRMCHGHMMT